MARITGKTKSGFIYSVNSELLNDYRVIKDIAKLDGDNDMEGITATVNLIELLLGKNGAKALEKHVTQKNGVVPLNKMMDEIGQILSGIGQANENAKNL